MKLNIRAPWNNLSYGIVSKNIIKQLSNKRCDISLFPIGPVDATNSNTKLLSHILNNHDVDYNAPSLSIFHQFALAEHISNPHFGYTIFEIDQLTNFEKMHIKSCNTLFVPSKWAKSIVDEELKGKVKCIVAPIGVNRDIFQPKTIVNKYNTTIFLYIGKFEKRKGVDVVVDIFNSAFKKDDNVSLYMMVSNPFIDSKIIDRYIGSAKNSKLGEKIHFFPKLSTDNEVATIMNEATCGIFPHRAEGYCMPALEMLSCGKEIIITNYSAPTEFCNNENSYLVEIDDVENAYDGVFFKSDNKINTGNWAKLDTDQISQFIAHMRLVHKLKQENGALTNEAGITTAEQFSWENCGRIIHRELQRGYN